MPSVIIKDMEMPGNCYDCPFGADVNIGVGVAHGCSLLKDFAQFADERHPDCPLHPAPEWVSVEERLPEEWKPVLTYQPTFDAIGLRRVSIHIGNGKWRVAERHEMLELPVTHWMPLPEPVDEKEADQCRK